MRHKLAAAAVVVIKMMCATTLFFAFVFTVYAIGPSLETRYWPVVSKLDVLSIRETAAGHTEIKAGFRKLRDCEYIGLVWFLGSRPDDFQRVSVILQREAGDTSSPNRPIGYQKAGPWIIGMSPADLRGKSFAQLVHRCHPFWMTTTEFYP